MTSPPVEMPPGKNPGWLWLLIQCAAGTVIFDEPIGHEDIDQETLGAMDRTTVLAHLREHGCQLVNAVVYDGTTGSALSRREVRSHARV